MKHLPQGWILSQWMYGGSTAAEKDIHEAINLCLRYRAVGLMEKTHDGTSWMGHIRNLAGQLISPNSPKSIADVEDHKRRCDEAGLLYIPWTNPLWGNRFFLADQAKLYAEVGNVAGIIAWDSEPYDEFWGAWRPEGDAFFMLEEFRRHAPSVVNIWQPDPRWQRLQELRPEEWAQHMNVFAPQSYYGAFGTSPSQQIITDHGHGVVYGIDECAPTLSSDNATPTSIAQALGTMAQLGITTTFAWRLGSLDTGQLEMLRDLAGPIEDPDPVDPHEQCKADLAHVTAERDMLKSDIADMRVTVKTVIHKLEAEIDELESVL